MKLKSLITEQEFKAKSKETGRVVVYKSKDSMDKAIKGGRAEPLDKKTGDKPKGFGLFKKNTETIANVFFVLSEGEHNTSSKTIFSFLRKEPIFFVFSMPVSDMSLLKSSPSKLLHSDFACLKKVTFNILIKIYFHFIEQPLLGICFLGPTPVFTISCIASNK